MQAQLERHQQIQSDSFQGKSINALNDKGYISDCHDNYDYDDISNGHGIDDSLVKTTIILVIVLKAKMPVMTIMVIPEKNIPIKKNIENNHGGARCQLGLKAPLPGHSMKCLPHRYDDNDHNDDDDDDRHDICQFLYTSIYPNI